MWLFGLLGKKKRKRTNTVRKSSKVNSFGERMDRVTRKGELPYGWLYENRAFVEKHENEYRYFFHEYDKASHKGVKQEYAALKSLVMHMEAVQKLCKRKGKCFALWSTYMVANPKDIVHYKEQLKKLEVKIKTAKK